MKISISQTEEIELTEREERIYKIATSDNYFWLAIGFMAGILWATIIALCVLG